MATGNLATRKPRQRSSSAKAVRRVRFSYESPARLKQMERGFVLDGVTLSRHSNDEIGRNNPTLNFAIPQYNALDDPHCKSYFKMKGLPKTVKKVSENRSASKDDSSTDRGAVGSSMMGPVFDKFVRSASATQYIGDRGEIGAGYTRRIYGGHLTVPTELPPLGYNGPEGYRRNTPDLRAQKSVFDYEDPFDNPRPINRRPRTMSAPATMRLMRQKSARVYQQQPRAVTALPRTNVYPTSRELAVQP